MAETAAARRQRQDDIIGSNSGGKMSAIERAVAQTWILWRQQGGSKIAARQQQDGVDRNSETAATVAETATATVTVMAGTQTWI